MIFSPLRLTRVLQRYLGNLVDGLGADGDMLADIESAVEFLDKKEKEEADAARLEAEAWWKAKVDAQSFGCSKPPRPVNRWAGKEKGGEDAKNAKAEADRITPAQALKRNDCERRENRRACGHPRTPAPARANGAAADSSYRAQGG